MDSFEYSQINMIDLVVCFAGVYIGFCFKTPRNKNT